MPDFILASLGVLNVFLPVFQMRLALLCKLYSCNVTMILPAFLYNTYLQTNLLTSEGCLDFCLMEVLHYRNLCNFVINLYEF